MLQINDVRLIFAKCLLAGMTFHTGLRSFLFTLKRHGKRVRDHLLSAHIRSV